jgi:taurine dioxygenase
MLDLAASMTSTPILVDCKQHAEESVHEQTNLFGDLDRESGAGAVTLSITPLTSAIGAEIHGVDLRGPLSDEVVAAIRQALMDHFVVFFRDQDITVEQHVAFGRRFGQLRVGSYAAKVAFEDFPELVSFQGGAGLTDRWHSDDIYREVPSLGRILHAVKLPAVGGDTCFASMAHAYEALSPSMQRFLDGLTAVNDNVVINQSMKKIRGGAQVGVDEVGVTHPLVWVHPETGRKLLYATDRGTVRINELSEDESAAILRFLAEHVKSPLLQCRFRWERNSMAFWDNRAVQHFAVSDYTGERVMHSVTIVGEHRPAGPSGPEAALA